MATFTAAVPLNCVVRIQGVGEFEIRGATKGTPLAAGQSFTVPDAMASAFETIYGTAPVAVPPRRRWESTGPAFDRWTSPGPVAGRPIIPGLTRLA